MGASFTTSGGRDPVAFVLEVTKAAIPTQGDLLYAGQRQRARILDRTTKLGIDANGAAFAPYSTKGPYYWYPAGPAGGKRSIQSRKAAVRRMFRIIGDVESHRGDLGSTRTKSGLGIKFPSYAAFKQSLGRGVVDLMGPAARMVRAIVVKVGGLTVQSDLSVGSKSYPQPATTVVVGLYGEEALRGQGHNDGIPGRLPKRHWFDSNLKDLSQMEADVAMRRAAVLQAVRE